jgi:hypothetical protein
MKVSIIGLAQAIDEQAEKSMLDWSKLLSAQTGLTKTPGDAGSGGEEDETLRRELEEAARRQNEATR